MQVKCKLGIVSRQTIWGQILQPQGCHCSALRHLTAHLICIIVLCTCSYPMHGSHTGCLTTLPPITMRFGLKLTEEKTSKKHNQLQQQQQQPELTYLPTCLLSGHLCFTHMKHRWGVFFFSFLRPTRWRRSSARQPLVFPMKEDFVHFANITKLGSCGIELTRFTPLTREYIWLSTQLVTIQVSKQ